MILTWYSSVYHWVKPVHISLLIFPSNRIRNMTTTAPTFGCRIWECWALPRTIRHVFHAGRSRVYLWYVFTVWEYEVWRRRPSCLTIISWSIKALSYPSAVIIVVIVVKGTRCWCLRRSSMLGWLRFFYLRILYYLHLLFIVQCLYLVVAGVVWLML